MEASGLCKATLGIMGIVIGIALVTLLRVAAVDGFERERMRHAQARPIFAAARVSGECVNVAHSGGQRIE